MSAVVTPPASVDTEAQLRLPTAAAPTRIRLEPEAAPSRVTQPSRSTERFRQVLFFAAWAPVYAVASVVGAVALAVATPIVLARPLRRAR
jgi:hypothetical protein